MKAGMFLSCAVLALSAGVASAQTSTHDSTAIEEIVVTAQKRSENLQDVPVSVTALTSDALAARGVNNVLALNNLAPGMRISAADAAANPKIYIRGVGLSDFNPNASSGVGVYVDGVYIGSPLAQMAGFFDLAQIEVLRGPQGTLYGRNTNGGAINITTKRPSQTFGADASLEYGSFNAVTADLGVGGPIVADKLAFRVAAQYVKDDGYTYNRVTGHDLNAADHWAGRMSLLYTPTQDFELLTQVNRYVNRGDAKAWGLETERQIDRGGSPMPSRVSRITKFKELIDPIRLQRSLHGHWDRKSSSDGRDARSDRGGCGRTRA